MTPKKILTIRIGASRTGLLPGQNGTLLIDGGYRVGNRCFFTHLKIAGSRPQQVTHGLGISWTNLPLLTQPRGHLLK